MKNCELVNHYAKLLKENGWEQTHDWVKNVSNDISKDDMRKYASLESQGVVDADVVIMLFLYNLVKILAIVWNFLLFYY